MALIDLLSTDFTHSTRNKGQAYYARKAVTIDHAGEDSLHAIVQGGMPYDVDVSWDGEIITYACTCPFFVEHDVPCKHIWATLLAAEAAGKLPKPDLTIEPDEDSSGIEDEDDPYGPQFYSASSRQITPISKRPAAAPSKHTVWRRRLEEVKSAMQMQQIRGVNEPDPWPANREIIYIIDVSESLMHEAVVVMLSSRSPKKSGVGMDKPRQLRMSRSQIATLPDTDRDLISMLAGLNTPSYGYYATQEVPRRIELGATNTTDIVRRLCRTGRCRLRAISGQDDPPTISWDEGPAWEPVLSVIPTKDGKSYLLQGKLRRGEETMDLTAPKLLLASGVLFYDDKAAALADPGAFAFISLLRRERDITIPLEQADSLLKELMSFPRLPRLDLPDPIKLTELRPTPKLRLKMLPPRRNGYDDRLRGQLTFDYGERLIAHTEANRVIYEAEQRRVIHRDDATERGAVVRLRELGFREEFDQEVNGPEFRLSPKHLPKVVRQLIADKWHVEVEGKIYRQPGQIKMEVSSGIDWFELNGVADFDGINVALPKLLAAIRKGETTILLDDGTLGMLPEQWLKQYGLLAALGETQGEKVQFTRSQAGLLDALLATQPEVSFDETFAHARQQLRSFAGVRPVEPPASFVGDLRPYQKDALGWLEFLRTFGLNGCLADDMGLGKTVQVLALLEQRRLLRAEVNGAAANGAAANGDGTTITAIGDGNPNGNGASGNRTNGENENPSTNSAGNAKNKPAKRHAPKIGPSIVVVPRSLVFNWKQEAMRFTPNLRVLDHAGVDRPKAVDHFVEYDLIIATYGTVRNDIAALKDISFDYVILDESQAIKNAGSESAKAARLLKGQHRLALSGTPVQNHLGELWSLFEFLNPGMLGASKAFGIAAGNGARVIPQETRELLASALRPFILRRTKEQVAKELPEKVEQTLYCELDTKQRNAYNELKEHYRQSLLTKVATDGIAKSKFQILEALLRLRQAACHPGLLDKSRVDESSAKFDALLPRLEEVAEDGHKAIVFSQFTSLLAIIRKKLDADGIVYEYLDGKTRDRQARVERFQTDPNCKLFLISLKAGGVGLNLTAAQYVFLLDPWWNPAVEAQAIDRAHRIGQTKNVFAYRLIAKDTVEEKVLQLQQTKRDLADAIINADNALISKLGREDLELLLS